MQLPYTPSIDLEELKRLYNKYIGGNVDWDNISLRDKMHVGLDVLRRLPFKNPGGVHTDVENPLQTGTMFDYFFDLRDEEENPVLEFTEEKPFLAACSRKTDEMTIFPELKNVRWGKGGMYTNEVRHALGNGVFEEKFDTFWIRYDCGYMEKISKDYPASSGEIGMERELLLLLDRSPDTMWKRGIESRLAKLEKLIA